MWFMKCTSDTDMPCAKKLGMYKLSRYIWLTHGWAIYRNPEVWFSISPKFQPRDLKSGQSLFEISSGGSKIGPLGAVVFSALCQRHAPNPRVGWKRILPRAQTRQINNTNRYCHLPSWHALLTKPRTSIVGPKISGQLGCQARQADFTGNLKLPGYLPAWPAWVFWQTMGKEQSSGWHQDGGDGRELFQLVFLSWLGCRHCILLHFLSSSIHPQLSCPVHNN